MYFIWKQDHLKGGIYYSYIVEFKDKISIF